MAETNTPKKRWLWGFWGIVRDALVSAGIALGLDSWVKDWVKDLFTKHVGPITGETIKQTFTDQRADMLREFRKMEDAGINIDNLRRRHAEAMDRSKVDRWAEYRFVQLLCKIQPPDPANPRRVKPPITLGTPGKPQNDRQADLKWLNDQGNPGDPRFDQMMHFLDHDVVTQMFQVGYDWTGRFLKNLRSNLKAGWTNLAQLLHTYFGTLGDWLVATAEEIRDSIVSVFRKPWKPSTRRFITAAISMIVLILFFGFLKKRGVTKIDATNGSAKVVVSSFLGAAIVISLIAIEYHKLVPVFLDIDLWHYGVLLLLVAAFYFWRVAPLRYALLTLVILMAPIFFFGGRTAAKSAWFGTQEERHEQEDRNLQAQISARDQELATLRNKREGEVKKVAFQPPMNTDEQNSGADGASSAGSLNVQAPAQVAEQACPSLPQPIEYGDFTFVLTHCGVRGNQVRLAGNVQYGGQEKTNMYFHPFKALDDAGDIYVVQAGRFGSSDNFGLGHSGQWMYPPTSVPYSVPFSLELGPENVNLPPAGNITLVMPCSDQMGGQIVVSLALK